MCGGNLFLGPMCGEPTYHILDIAPKGDGRRRPRKEKERMKEIERKEAKERKRKKEKDRKKERKKEFRLRITRGFGGSAPPIFCFWRS